MARRITGAYPLNVKEGIFTDGRKLEDVKAWIVNNFLIVATDGRPDMYSLNIVSELHGVEEIRPTGGGYVWSI